MHDAARGTVLLMSSGTPLIGRRRTSQDAPANARRRHGHGFARIVINKCLYMNRLKHDSNRHRSVSKSMQRESKNLEQVAALHF